MAVHPCMPDTNGRSKHCSARVGIVWSPLAFSCEPAGSGDAIFENGMIVKSGRGTKAKP